MDKSDFLVVVDVQPAYQDACEDIIYEVIEKINKSVALLRRIIFELLVLYSANSHFVK